MKKVKVCIDLEEAKYNAYASEAVRRGVAVEEFLAQTIHDMIVEHDESVREEEEDHQIIFP